MMITEGFEKRIRGAFGRAGTEWLQDLSMTLKNAANRWSLKLLEPFHPLTYNYVSPAIGCDGRQMVLKAGVPGSEFNNEIDALRHFDGDGAVRLIEADPGAGLMLLERLRPGKPVLDLQDDDTATFVFSEVMRKLKRPSPENHDFPSIEDWAGGFSRMKYLLKSKPGPFPLQTVDRAEKIFGELHESMSEPILLHGDLHHWNILSSGENSWLAIDPKGVIGEQEYETGAWLRNPFPQLLRIPDVKKLTQRRLDIIAEQLGFDRLRLTGWAYSQAVLSGLWSFEENLEEWRGWLKAADVFSEIMLSLHK